MGLDTSHDCWHGAYGAFSRWRDKLAEVAGYGFVPCDCPSLWCKGRLFVDIDWDLYHGGGLGDTLMGEWVETPEDPLLVLMVHSDCDGWIRTAQTDALATRLTELLPLLPDEDGGGHIGHWQVKTQRFIDGLRLAAECCEDVRFA
jgi:hypothetical protein